MRDLKADLELCNGFAEMLGEETLEDAITKAMGQSFSEFKKDTFATHALTGWPHAIERAIEAEAKLEKAKDLIQRWFDEEISAFDVMDSMIIDLEFDIDGIPDEVLEYHNIKRKEVPGDE